LEQVTSEQSVASVTAFQLGPTPANTPAAGLAASQPNLAILEQAVEQVHAVSNCAIQRFSSNVKTTYLPHHDQSSFELLYKRSMHTTHFDHFAPCTCLWLFSKPIKLPHVML
jgi:hypothetical protein